MISLPFSPFRVPILYSEIHLLCVCHSQHLPATAGWVQHSSISNSSLDSWNHEQYSLDNEWRKNHDDFFGEVNGRSRWIDTDEAEEMEGAQGVLEEGDCRVILTEGVKPDGTWSAMRIWGFEGAGEERRYTLRVKDWNKDGEEDRVKMVYDFVEEER